MPNAFEFPGMLCAVVPLVSAGHPVVIELASNWFPILAAIIGALDLLTEPAARLRRKQSRWFGGRSLEMINFPASEMRFADLPALTLAVRRQNERSFSRANQYSYFALALRRFSVLTVACLNRITFSSG